MRSRDDIVESPIYTVAGLDEHLAPANERTMANIVEQLRSPLGVIPFVGAGMSAPFRFPLWDGFLRGCALEFDLGDVIELLDVSDYEAAAERLAEFDEPRFSDRLTHDFGRRIDADRLREGAISYLPLLTTGPVITTNFDGVLEDAFAANGRPFENIVEGARDQPTVDAIHRNRRALLKIHGSFADRTFRVFTKDQYRRSYEEGEANLTSLAWLTFTNRPLLFLGSSLESDRTVDVLAEIHRQLGALRHYALLEARYDRRRQAERERQLSNWGVQPLWYPAGHHERIEPLLAEMVERAGTREVLAATRTPPTPTATAPRLSPRPQAGDDYDVRLIARHVAESQVAFSLGSGAHLNRLVLGDPFYAQMAEHFDCPTLTGDRSAVAAFVASRQGPHALWDWVRDQLDRPVELSAVYRLLVALPAYLRARRKPPLWVFMTNYDAVLERALADADEPFHLLYYMELEGRFAHTAPDGSVRVIERPEAIRALRPEATVVVKLNGGIVDGPQPTETAVIASGQFERLAAAIPDVLPACVQTTLRERRLLFLGHGLNEPDLQRVMEFAASDRKPAWVLQQRPTDPARAAAWEERAGYFARLGAVTLERPLGEFVEALQAELF